MPQPEPSPQIPASRTLAPRPVRFVHRGQVHEVTGLPPTTTVLQWLREHARCTGTKEGCAEGDCGACTVVVGELDADGALQRRTVNACIQFLPTLDGRALFTVEDVSTQCGASTLHPCQQAMVDCHGSQCGFCTPGFVMSLWHQYESHATPQTRAELADALAGNLCRCTGYRPILDAGERMYATPRQALDTAPTVALLQGLQSDADLLAIGPNAQHPGSAQRFFAPRSMEALATLRQALPHARLLAGSTDIGLWVNKQFRDLGDILYLGRVAELQTIEPLPDGRLHIGAGAPLEAAWRALAERVPALHELWKRFASPPVRHVGTMGGNVANGSPIGDSAPVLLALGASVVLRCGEVVRELPLSAFYLDYMKNAMQPGEFLQALRVPTPHGPDEVMRAYKLSKRRDSDISAVCAGLWLRLDGDTVVEARLGWGGMAATPRRAPLAEAALAGQPWSETTMRAAQVALAQDFSPLTDLRASATYRQQAAAGLLERFWYETRRDADLRALPALAADQVQVWPARA